MTYRATQLMVDMGDQWVTSIELTPHGAYFRFPDRAIRHYDRALTAMIIRMYRKEPAYKVLRYRG